MAATDSMRSGDCVMFMCVYVPRVKNIIITAVTDSRQQRNEVSTSFAFPFYADECVWDLGERMTAVTATQADKWIKHRNKQEDAPNRMRYFIKKGRTRVHLNCSPLLTNLTIYIGTKEIAVILAQNKNNTGFNVFGTSVITSTVCSKVCAEHLPE